MFAITTGSWLGQDLVAMSELLLQSLQTDFQSFKWVTFIVEAFVLDLSIAKHQIQNTQIVVATWVAPDHNKITVLVATY